MKTLSTPAMAAKEIKALLKNKYPHIKFSVKSERYSGGNSVRISWNLGMKREEIEKLVKDYECGHFDGMNDMYEYSNVKEGIPQTKYIFCERIYHTDEEIANHKLDYNQQRDLYAEGKTLYHDIAKEVHNITRVTFNGISSQVPEFLATCYSAGQELICWNDLAYRLLAETTFDTDSYTGYKVDFDVTETGDRITNKFRIIKKGI